LCVLVLAWDRVFFSVGCNGPRDLVLVSNVSVRVGGPVFILNPLVAKAWQVSRFGLDLGSLAAVFYG